jgi:hypothetical protein
VAGGRDGGPTGQGTSLSPNIGEESVTVRGDSAPPGARWTITFA